MTAGYAVLAEKLHASFCAARDLHLDGLLGKPEPLGNLALRHALEFAEDEDFTTATGKRVDGLEQQSDFLSHADSFSHVFAFLNDAQDGGISYGIRRKDLWTPKYREGDIPRGGEEIRPGAGHGSRFPGLEEADVTFLDDVVDVACLWETATQPRAQVRLMGLNFLGKPAGLVWVRWGHVSTRIEATSLRYYKAGIIRSLPLPEYGLARRSRFWV